MQMLFLSVLALHSSIDNANAFGILFSAYYFSYEFLILKHIYNYYLKVLIY